MTAVLTVEGLTKEFGGVRAVDELGFTISEGAIFSIIGPNGAGKTTLFNLITGVYTPTEGRVFFGGEFIGGKTPYNLADMGLSRTFQNLQIFMNMTAVENVMVGLHRHLDKRIDHALFRIGGMARKEREAREKAAELMAFVGLGQYVNHDAASMSYGALKRLEIARALATGPRLLLLDEPAAGLNPSETGEIDELIRKVSESGVTVALVEHDMHLVMGISDHILVLDYGRKLTEGTAEHVRHDPEVIAAYLGSEAAAVKG
ncbi:MAG: ABC transporter ATP-binding protein [Rhodospirillales bacterium]|nr:ABC transporter ATP-binding protein [Rhodospirillales bacterium]MCW8861126.1 ABC transporter ATP-binding protein [Rhodospirillales bacterium]MCW8951865.1 ABC transporter ATP-binding protein [Rhodospirillales bacterium]MCW8971484.1 ABC transporter ATP-binding protein [Rhodospirillales bacterium]MCW9002856.1 ABC transporter ATP-binding protein [Rhodospirillales bacterium]